MMPYTLDEDFARFLTDSGLSQEPYGVRLKLRRAYEANWRPPATEAQRNGREPVIHLAADGGLYTDPARDRVPLYLNPLTVDEIADMVGKSHRNPLIP